MAKHLGFIGCSIIVALSLLFSATEARQYHVGDSFGWNTPPNQTFYSDWASSKTFFVGDSLVFNWTGNQNVADVTMAEYNNCTDVTSVFTGPSGTVFTINLLNPGRRYFICTVDDHCERGQKFSINVEWPISSGLSPSAQPTPFSSAPTLSYGILSAFLSIIAVYFFTCV
ncbi:stellacyanin-like [Neltuma alba]|uniref:stellacyanin-like n=1 Tax=Neltuma alba TaxID=207710 RepID=UPI0010A4E6DD|nr:stellacyanin-like [Prosopis alba]